MLNRRAFLATAGATLITGPTASLAQTALSKKLRIVVVANRYHEADGLMAALGNQMAHSSSLSLPHDVVWPRTFPPDLKLSSKPRCLIDVKKNPSDADPSASVEIWYVDDIANTKGDSGAKVTAMKTITDYGPAPDGVVAFGTAGYPGDASNDGCATIGGTIFIHDASNGASGSWSWPGHMDTLIPSKAPASFFSSVAADPKTQNAISLEMIKPKKQSREHSSAHYRTRCRRHQLS